jgi:hypothetical protein
VVHPNEHGNTAGWGAHMLVQVHADGRAEVLAQLWGPVVTNPTSVWSIGCTRGTNNTAEVTGMADRLSKRRLEPSCHIKHQRSRLYS